MFVSKASLFASIAVAGLFAAEAGAVEVDYLVDSGDLAGPATEISIAGPAGSYLLTAMRESSGHLKVIRWSAEDTKISRYGSKVADEIVTATAIDWGILPLGDKFYWANVVVTNGHRKVIVWKLSGSGPVRTDDDEGGVASKCDVATLGNTPNITAYTYFATLCQGPSSMTLEVFSVKDNGAVGYEGSRVLPAGTDPNIAYMGEDNGLSRFITAYRNANGDLRVGLYTINQVGHLSNDEDDAALAGPVSQVALAANPYGEAETGLRLMDGSFEMIKWTVTPSNQLHRGVSAKNGYAHGAAVGYLYDGYWGTADRNPDGTLDVDVWTTYEEDADGGGMPMQGGVALQTVFAGSDGRMFTAVTDAAGNFKLTAWRVGEPTDFNP